MKNCLNRWFAVFFLALLGPILPAQASDLTVGRDYNVMSPRLATDDPAKIEVIEFMSYACPHCSALNPAITRWVKKLPKDVAFKRIPAGFNPYYKLMAQLYYALEAVGELDRLDEAVFTALHVKELRLIDESSILEWVTAQGVDARKFSEAFHSFGVLSKVNRADQLAREAKIPGAPTIIVDGRYMVMTEGIRSHEELLERAEKLIDKRRKERAGK